MEAWVAGTEPDKLTVPAWGVPARVVSTDDEPVRRR